MRQALRLLIHRCDRSTWNLTRFIQIGIIRSPRVQHTKLVTQNIAKRNSYYFPIPMEVEWSTEDTAQGECAKRRMPSSEAACVACKFLSRLLIPLATGA